MCTTRTNEILFKYKAQYRIFSFVKFGLDVLIIAKGLSWYEITNHINYSQHRFLLALY